MLPQFLNDPSIKKLLRRYDPEELVFKQGQPGNTMYLVAEGMVRILHQGFGVDQLVGIVGAGEVLGERGVLDRSPYIRNFTAQAKTTAMLIELDATTLKVLLKNVPDFHMRMLKMVLDRLDKANHLTSVLQLPHPLDRLGEYLKYFAMHYCKNLPKGLEVAVTASEICHSANIPRNIVDEYLAELLAHKVLQRGQSGYLIAHLESIDMLLPKLKERLAA